MNVVDPIKDNNVVHDILYYLKESNERNYIMFMVGIYTGLRISDILKLKVKDVKGKKSLNIHDMKTGKLNRLDFNSELRRALVIYTAEMPQEEYLIKSRNGYNKPITRSRAYVILNEAAQQFGIDNIGTHTMRKTFGLNLYRITRDMAQVQTALNHSDVAHTRRYIGIDREVVNQSIKRLHY